MHTPTLAALAAPTLAAELAAARTLTGRTFGPDFHTVRAVSAGYPVNPARRAGAAVLIETVDMWNRRRVWTAAEFTAAFPASF